MKIRVQEPVVEVIERVIEPEKIVIEFTRAEAEALASVVGRFSAFADQPLKGFYNKLVDEGIVSHKYEVKSNEHGVILVTKK